MTEFTQSERWKAECLAELKKMSYTDPESIGMVARTLAEKSYTAPDFPIPACMAFRDHWNGCNSEGRLMTMWAFHRVLLFTFKEAFKSNPALLRTWQREGWEFFLRFTSQHILEMKSTASYYWKKIIRMPGLFVHTPNNQLDDGTECHLYSARRMREMAALWGAGKDAIEAIVDAPKSSRTQKAIAPPQTRNGDMTTPPQQAPDVAAAARGAPHQGQRPIEAPPQVPGGNLTIAQRAKFHQAVQKSQLAQQAMTAAPAIRFALSNKWWDSEDLEDPVFNRDAVEQAAVRGAPSLDEALSFFAAAEKALEEEMNGFVTAIAELGCLARRNAERMKDVKNLLTSLGTASQASNNRASKIVSPSSSSSSSAAASASASNSQQE
uniref:Uncharacterized protein n=1 Tax=Chromera velia CCMP2878 TaxID=1169474 RepID=A0A0G4I861_9ALVE|mmetsp:Transcript_26896/g.52814  ORF Transcript_26896/g.52814 Transcript_26896/m.52814 type:complete len:380 (+) Transcript_26896:195-1334(+)|eukprot:Cvel_11865.t1-p1 / transcript=Cvel_11865.t1 / gene=Cvel_11865 / organism=Chromera_velia_CCMP2878 / gene_product=hypothetical protein / transcript_product=hypothetical protein / location=Cvel_scaffold757:16639-21185(-) / protein_length=379 / sequence_SO=supercontig / SO=protein_coding / is_pseudo=false